MNDSNDRQWLAVNSTITKLKQISWWMTDLDPWKKHVDKAISELQEAKKLLEEK